MKNGLTDWADIVYRHIAHCHLWSNIEQSTFDPTTQQKPMFLWPLNKTNQCSFDLPQTSKQTHLIFLVLPSFQSREYHWLSMTRTWFVQADDNQYSDHILSGRFGNRSEIRLIIIITYCKTMTIKRKGSYIYA
jgi:hypothetical protein